MTKSKDNKYVQEAKNRERAARLKLTRTKVARQKGRATDQDVADAQDRHNMSASVLKRIKDIYH